jgi:acyl CoA:acetate/3-ketoacid CoA transferase alpha subunit/acyl CoA:acetate/3-ketoacid CoA transferase beta subunit
MTEEAFPLSTERPFDEAILAGYWDRLLAAEPGCSKVSTLREAVRCHVRPGACIYLGGSLARPNAAMYEIARAFWDTTPGFTIALPAFANQHAVLVRGGLVKRVITSIHGNTFPAPGPNPVFVEADRRGEVVFEEWSLLSLVQRLIAGATGTKAALTRSLIGSDVGRLLEDQGKFRAIDDSFGGDDTAWVASLNPDVAFVHGLLADRHGNTVLSPPWYDDSWAAFAASGPVVVTVERIVPTEVVRRYAQFVRLPGSAVTAVCEVPMGGHPNQVPGDLVPEAGGYYDDYDFLAELREVCADPERLDAWIEEWVLGCAGHAEYVAKLGAARIHRLRGATRRSGWRSETEVAHKRWPDAPTSGELLATVGARFLVELVTGEDLRVALAGIGVATLSAWMASLVLRTRGQALDLLAEAGMYGYTPMPFDPYLFNYRNLFTSASLTNVQTMLGVVVGGRNNRAIGVLGAAQVDRTGALNTTRVGGKLLTGPGGANDIATTATAVMVSVPHRPDRLVEKVEFITSPGHRVRAIVTDRAVLERSTPDGEFVLTGVLQRDGASSADLVRAAVDRCGWPLTVSREVDVLAEVTPSELAMIRTFDPAGNFVA